MKRDKLKRVRIVLQTMDTEVKEKNCFPVFTGMTIEQPDSIRMKVAVETIQKRTNFDGTVDVEVRAGRIGIEKGGENAEIPAELDYNYFRSKYSKMLIAAVEAEIFDFGAKKNIPCRIKNMEMIFGNRKKVELAERISVLELDRLAS